MKTVIMDTSNNYLVIGLYVDGQALAKYQEKSKRRQSEDAIIRLNEILKQNNLDILTVDEMVITIGPGSYTGQRVALTIAKTLAAISNIKIKAVSSLHGYAGNNQAIALLDARSQKVFVGVYQNNQPLIQDTIIDLTAFEDFRSNYPGFDLVGDVKLLGLDEIEVDLCHNIYQASLNYPYVDDVDNLIPHYIKEVAAKKL